MPATPWIDAPFTPGAPLVTVPPRPRETPKTPVKVPKFVTVPAAPPMETPAPTPPVPLDAVVSSVAPLVTRPPDRREIPPPPTVLRFTTFQAVPEGPTTP